MNDICVIIKINGMRWLKNFTFRKNDMTIIIDSLRGYSKYRKIIKGKTIFRINNFRLLNGEIISIVGDLKGIDFIFVDRGKIGYLGENCDMQGKKEKYLVDECTICMDSNNIKYILCGHGICKDCIKEIMKKKREEHKCPICRAYIGRINNVVSIKKERAKELF